MRYSALLCLACLLLHAKSFNWTFPNLTAAIEGGDYLHLHWEFRNLSSTVSQIVFVVNVSKDYDGCTVGFTGEVLGGDGNDIINMAFEDQEDDEECLTGMQGVGATCSSFT